MRARSLCVPLLLCARLALAAPTESLSTPPPDVASARGLNAPPHVVVEVRTVDEPPKDARCKDPVCLAIVVPFLLFETAFPKQHDAVTVTVDGERRLLGVYEVGGRFRYGHIYSPEGERIFEALELPRLGRRLIVETGRRGPGEKAPLEKVEPRLPVEELLAEYRQLLASSKYPKDQPEERGGAILEALRVLGEPAMPFVLERLSDPTEADAVKAEVLSVTCDSQRQAALDTARMRKLLDAATLGDAGPETRAAGVGCRVERKLGVPRPMIGALVAGFCREETLNLEGRAYTRLSLLKQSASPALDPSPFFRDACEQPARRAVLRTCLGAGAEREEYAAAFAAKDGSDKAVLQCLQKDQPGHRVGFEEAFRAAPYERLEWVEGRKAPLAAWELEALARDFDTLIKPYWKRAWVVDQFARAAGDPERTAPARAVLREWVRKTETEHTAVKEKEGNVMRFLRGVQDKVVGPGSNDLTVAAGIALMALGEVDETPRAAKSLPREPRPIAMTEVSNEFDLAQYAFTRVGCTRAEMQAASTLLHAGKALPPGAWCASQKQGR